MFLSDKNLTHKSLCKSEVHFENVFPRLTTRHTLLNFFVNFLVGLNHGRPPFTHSNPRIMHKPTTSGQNRSDLMIYVNEMSLLNAFWALWISRGPFLSSVTAKEPRLDEYWDIFVFIDNIFYRIFHLLPRNLTLG